MLDEPLTRVVPASDSDYSDYSAYFNLKLILKLGYFLTINRNIEKQANVMLINTYPRFPSFY